MSSDLRTARHTAAVAFVKQGLPKGKTWADLHYTYDYQEGDMLYLAIYDDNPKKTIEAKITEAAQAYQARFGTLPTVALVSEDDKAPERVGGLRTQVEKRINRNNIHVGID